MGRLALVALLLTATACFERGGDRQPPSDPVVAPSIDAAPRAPMVRPQDRSEGWDIDPEATISLALEAEPAHLNPLLGGDAITNRIALGDIYEGLLCAEDTIEPPEPCLAESVTVNDAGTVWTFTLRSGVSWHDGEPLTVDDVERTLNLLTGPNPAPSYLVAEVDDFVSFERSGERTFSITFGGFRIGRRGLFARMPILPSHLFAKTPAPALATSPRNHAPVGTGPLRFVAWHRGESIELARNDDYWGTKARARRIVYRVYTGRQRAIRAVGAGEVDLVVQVPADEADAAADEHADIGAFAYETPAYLAAVYNLRRAALSRVEVRRALTMLMDRPGINRELFSERSSQITGPFLSHDTDAEGVDPLPFDPKAAGAALTERPTLTILVPAGSRTMGRIADIWASDARPYATLKIAEVPFSDLLGRLRAGDFDIAMMGFTTSPDVDLYTRFHSSQIGRENYGALADPALDRLLEAARSEPRDAERTELSRRIHQRLHTLQPYTFILSDTRVGLVRLEVCCTSATQGMPPARVLWHKRK